MSHELADAAVDLFTEQSASQPKLTLSYFGGEPFLALDSMKRVAERMRRKAGSHQQVKLVTPTNGLLLDAERLQFCRDQHLELAISVDGTLGPAERCHPDGRDSVHALVDRLPDILSLDPAARITARMTATPANVDRLASNVRALARLGFRRIAIQAAFEQPWDEAAVQAWGREHRKIGTWLVGAHGAGVSVPDLPAWRAVERRLLSGRPRTSCGAGSRVAAVATDGSLYPCYRFVFEKAEAARLGHVSTGFTNREALDLFASLSPEQTHPEQGECAACPAKDGCIHYCPAMGYLMLGDARAIPEVACKLMRAQVAAIRPYAVVQRQPSRRASPSRWAAAAFVAAAVTSAGAAASCGGEATTGSNTLPKDASVDEGYQGGVCPVQFDAQPDQNVGGVCPVQVDAQGDAIGGYCDYQDATEEYVGGQCPVQIDAADEYVGGKCAEYPDAQDEYAGGVCPYVDDSGQVPGLC